MADDSTPNRHVAYAERYAAGPLNRFNALAALERARTLLHETQTVVEIFKVEGDKEERADWWWQGLEIVPYTLVALATCLEWHARSRLTDLYTFKPDAIDAKALEGKVPPKILSQMIRARVSVPQLLGVSFTVGSIGEYLGVFTKLFDSLGIPARPERVIQPPVIEQFGLFGDAIREPLVRDVIEELFSTRHALVHEIGHQTDEGRTLCQAWQPERVMWLCHTVISTIRFIEGALTKHAPTDFPNLLTDKGYPVDERVRLRRSIAEIEERIDATIVDRSSAAQASWSAALESARRSADAHETLFSDQSLFQRLDWGRTDLLSRTILEHRLALLNEVVAALAQSGASRPS